MLYVFFNLTQSSFGFLIQIVLELNSILCVFESLGDRIFGKELGRLFNPAISLSFQNLYFVLSLKGVWGVSSFS
jgi:hypothetical protein